ncbi:MAG: hypothetical protein M1482_08655 [Chloroflexi bacterium]|nr:hypothetical protein [Chloroflexota bacterium]
MMLQTETVGKRLERVRLALVQSLDIDAIKASPSRAIVAGGRTGREFFPYRAAARLAERLGTTRVEFPGNHAGCSLEPEEFAERLRAVLAGST